MVDAKPFKARSHWKAHNSPAYSNARNKGWLDEVCAHMTRLIKPNGYWTLARLKEDAKQFETRTEWQDNSSGYSRALELGLLEKCCGHMVQFQKPHGYWDEERSFKVAKKCKSRRELNKTYSAAYKKLFTLKLLDKACAHMVPSSRPAGYWTKATILESAKEFKHIGQWQKALGGAFNKARELGIVEAATKHMVPVSRIRKWTKEAVIADAKRFKNTVDWCNNSNGAYSTSYKNGWKEEATKHMVQLVKPPNFWNKKTLVEDANKYADKKEWRNNSSGAYTMASRLGLMAICAKHMPDLRCH